MKDHTCRDIPVTMGRERNYDYENRVKIQAIDNCPACQEKRKLDELREKALELAKKYGVKVSKI